MRKQAVVLQEKKLIPRQRSSVNHPQTMRGFNALPDHPTTRNLQHQALLQMQRRQGNQAVQRTMAAPAGMVQRGFFDFVEDAAETVGGAVEAGSEIVGDAAGVVGDVVSAGGEAVGEAAETAADTTAAGIDWATDTAAQGVDAVTGAASSGLEFASDVAERGANVAGQVGQFVGNTAERGANAVGGAASRGMAFAGNVAERVGGMVGPAGRAIGGAASRGARFVGDVAEQGMGLVGNVAGRVGRGAGRVVNAVGGAASRGMQFAGNVAGRVGRGAGRVANAVGGAASRGMQFAGNVAGHVGRGVGQVANAVGGVVAGGARIVGNTGRRILGAVGDAAGWVGETVNRALQMGAGFLRGTIEFLANTFGEAARALISSILNLPPRLWRLVQTIAQGLGGAISYIPRAIWALINGGLQGLGTFLWESAQAGLGWALTLVAQILELLGATDTLQFVLRILNNATPLTTEERAAADFVYGAGSINYSNVRIAEGAILDLIFKMNEGRAFTAWDTINMPSAGDHSRSNMGIVIHELMHVKQYQTVGTVYMGQAIHAQLTEGYGYDGSEGLRLAREEGRRFSSFNREQQGQIVQDFYNLQAANRDTTHYDPFIIDLRSNIL